jgi:hypothetical protein
LAGPAAPRFQEPQLERTRAAGQRQRAAALALGGASVAAFAVGAGFGIAANALYQDSEDDCRDDCNLEGFDARQRALDRGRIATIAFVVGASAAAGAGVLWLTAPVAQRARIGVGGLGTGSIDLRVERRW